MRARVKKLLAAGVVSALTCMVKTDSPVLTNASRELLARWAGTAGQGAGPGGEPRH